MEHETEGAELGAHPAELAEHETLGEETLAHAEVAMPQLDFGLYPNLIFWLIVALVAIYLILTRVALPRVRTILAERNDAIANDLEQAALLKRRAEEAEAAYAAALQKARDEAHRIAAETKAGIDRELAALTARADAEIAARAAESEKRIREIEATAAENVREVARETAAQIVATLGPRPAEEAEVAAAVDARLRS